MTPADTSSPPAAAAMHAQILDFLAYLELERGLSRNTLEAYRSDLLQLREFLDRRQLSAERATHGDLAAFLSELSRPRAGSGRRESEAARPAAASTLAPPSPEGTARCDCAAQEAERSRRRGRWT